MKTAILVIAMAMSSMPALSFGHDHDREKMPIFRCTAYDANGGSYSKTGFLSSLTGSLENKVLRLCRNRSAVPNTCYIAGCSPAGER